MAGIGFELRRFLKKDSYLGLLQAYGCAALISSGPWVLSIFGVVAIGAFSIGLDADVSVVTAFLISVTYLIACSIILGGWLQLMFTRYISDRIFDKEEHVILPNLLGALLITTLGSLLISAIVWPLFLETSLAYRLIMVCNLVILSNIWILVVMLSGLRNYNLILGSFFVGYGVSVFSAISLRGYGVEGLLAGFSIGQSIMMYMMLALLVREYPAYSLISFDFLGKKKTAFYSLAATSIVYNFGIWADKIMFWLNPETSEAIIGPIRSSFAYDPPIFIAYLAIIPGMAAFLLRIEADFVDTYDDFYNAIRNGKSLSTIKQIKAEMMETIKSSILEIFIVQLLTAVTIIYAASEILDYMGLSQHYWSLLSIYIVAVSLQVILMAINNILYYLDKRIITLNLAILFAISNIVFTLITQHYGAEFYGLGYMGAVVITTIVGFIILYEKLKKLEYETFMMQK
jgi:uncharacterized membrane protein